MNWYIGQDIVAVRDHSIGHFKRGDEFIVKGLQFCKCKCNTIQIDIGIKQYIKPSTTHLRCPICNAIFPYQSNVVWYHEVCFAPLDPIKEAISQLMEETLTIKQI